MNSFQTIHQIIAFFKHVSFISSLAVRQNGHTYLANNILHCNNSAIEHDEIPLIVLLSSHFCLFINVFKQKCQSGLHDTWSGRKCYVLNVPLLPENPQFTLMMTSSNGNNFRATLAFCAGNSPVNGEPPPPHTHKGQWREALMFSLICAWANS